MNRGDFNHFYPLSVRWGDADLYGHVNNVQYIRYYESARVAYGEEVLGLEFVVGHKENWILADIQCSYLQQLHYPVDLEVASSITRLGNSSAELQAAIYKNRMREPVSTSRAILVWMDLEGNCSKRIPDSFRERVECFEKKLQQ